jgi:hypothetical protein
MAHLVACPHCQKELRSALPYSPGATIQCPVCRTRFEAGSTTPMTLASPGVAKTSPVPQAMSSGGDAFADDFDALCASPESRGVTRNAAKPSPRRGRFLGAAAGLAALLLLAAAAFVWPGFLLPVRPPSQARTLLAYVPSNCTIVAGAQIGLFRKEPKFQAKWNDMLQQIAAFPNFPADARELLNSADEVVVGSGSDLQSSAVLVTSTEVPFDADKVRRLAKAGAAEQVQGQTIHPVNDLIPGRSGFLALPTAKIIVLGFLPRDEFVKLLTAVRPAPLHPDLQEQVDHAHSGLAWVAARFDERIKQSLQQAEGQFGLLFATLGPELPKLMGTIQRGKGALASVDLGDQNLKLSVGVTCRDGADAELCKSNIAAFWKTQSPQLFGLAAGARLFVPKLGKLLNDKLINDVQQSFATEQRGNTVLASIELQQDNLIDLADAIPQLGAPAAMPDFLPAQIKGLFPKKQP